MVRNREGIRQSICVLATTAAVLLNEVHVHAFATNGFTPYSLTSDLSHCGFHEAHRRDSKVERGLCHKGSCCSRTHLLASALETTTSLGFGNSDEAATVAAQRVPRAVPSPPKPPPSQSTNLSDSAKWHQSRRKAMLAMYSRQILPLEQSCDGLAVGLPLLLLSNVALAFMAIRSGAWSVPKIILLSFFPGSMFSLWQLQICHDVLHGALLPKTPSSLSSSPAARSTRRSRLTRYVIKKRRVLSQRMLFWGSMPSAFGYYLYLYFGHLTHHKSFGDPSKASLATLFNSTSKYFEDGDVLFVAHRMKLKGKIGPTFDLPQSIHRLFRRATLTMSISTSALTKWREGHYIYNACIFISSLLFERSLLVLNDLIVAITGRNYFFPNKPQRGFHDSCTTYCRWALAVRLALCALARSWWKPMLFLYLAETLWSLPPHPACAMFITNHGSDSDGDGTCVPSSSVYAGRWYSLLTLGTNYHVEHHDFPTVPLHKLGQLRKIAPEFYREGSGDNVFGIMRKTFHYPDFYACMDATIN